MQLDGSPRHANRLTRTRSPGGAERFLTAGSQVSGTVSAVRVFLAVCVVAALAAPLAGSAAVAPRPESPVASELTSVPFRNRVLPASTRSLQSFPLLASAWGGHFDTSTGESVAVYLSPSYPEDDSVPQHWADFLASLVHGPELATLTLLIAPLTDVQSACGGADVLACYSPSDRLILAPGEDVPDGPTVESVVTHEYGHHIAASRQNPPWDAVDYGPKRWASVVGVCRKKLDGKLFPGDELNHYAFNPAEAFAEDYRVLNEQLLGLPVTPWEIVDPSLEPDAATLAALEQDVVSPWTEPRSLTYTGSFRRGASLRPRLFTIQTPLDGTLRATLAAPRGTSFHLTLDGRPTLGTTTICGTRTTTATVTRTGGYGAFRIAVSAP